MNGYNQSFSSIYDLVNLGVDYDYLTEKIIHILNDFQIKNGIILDLACGTGEIASKLYLNGYELIGVDISEKMLSIAQQKYSDLDILWICQDMEHLDLFGTVDCTVCLMDSFNHLNGPKSLNQTIKKISLFLRPGGLLIFDMNSIYKHKVILGNNSFSIVHNGIICKWKNRYSEINNEVQIDLTYSYVSNGRKRISKECFKEFALPLEEIENILENNGLKIIQTDVGYPFDGKEFELSRYFIVCQKF